MSNIDDAVRRRLESDPVIQEMLLDMELANQKRAEHLAKDNPFKHRLSKQIADGKSTSYNYVGAKNTKSSQHRWCWACHKNIAGYYLVWYEIVTRKEVKRSRWNAEHTKKDAEALCLRRSNV